MTKHRFIVYGIITSGDDGGLYFKSECVAYDIKQLIDIYRDSDYSPHTIIRKEQVHRETPIHVIKMIEKSTSSLYHDVDDFI